MGWRDEQHIDARDTINTYQFFPEDNKLVITKPNGNRMVVDVGTLKYSPAAVAMFKRIINK